MDGGWAAHDERTGRGQSNGSGDAGSTRVGRALLAAAVAVLALVSQCVPHRRGAPPPPCATPELLPARPRHCSLLLRSLGASSRSALRTASRRSDRRVRLRFSSRIARTTHIACVSFASPVADTAQTIAMPESSSKAESSSSRRSSSSSLPSAHSQYNAAVAATAAAVTHSMRPPPAPTPPRESFSDLKWMWSRNIQSPSQLTKDQIEQKVMAGPRVQAAIERITSDAHSGGAGGAAASNTMSRDDAAKAAKAIFAGMYADVSQTVIRSSIYVMRKVWRTMYEGIRVNEEGIERLHEYAQAKVPVVLMPMHKSHVDYLLLTYVCAAYNLFPRTTHSMRGCATRRGRQAAT